MIAQKISPIGLANCGIVVPGLLYRGAQPDLRGSETTESGILSLFELGVKQVVDLRGEDKRTQLLEARECEQYGIEWHSIPIPEIAWGWKMPPWDTPPPTQVQAMMFLRLLDRSTFVHCKYGHDRTGAIVALYRRQVEKWSYEEARAEMDAFGFNPIHRGIDQWVRALPLKGI